MTEKKDLLKQKNNILLYVSRRRPSAWKPFSVTPPPRFICSSLSAVDSLRGSTETWCWRKFLSFFSIFSVQCLEPDSPQKRLKCL